MNVSFALLDHVPLGILVCDKQLAVRFWNTCIEDWTGIRREEIVGKRLASFFARFDLDRYRARLDLLTEGGPPVIFSYQLNGCVFPHRDAKRIERVQHVTATSFLDEEGERCVLMAVEDRTEVSSRIRAARTELIKRMATEDSLRKSVNEKANLMRELNHRVKNNLNMILSLINLQRDAAGPGPLRTALDDLDGRIRTFSVLHETMHKKEAETAIKLDEYLGSIVSELFESLKPSYSDAKLDIEIESIERPFQEALYLGLIASEALTNSMKYGLKPSGDGSIAITLRMQGADLTLTVKDDGPGFPSGFDPQTGDSLGLKLIRLLAEELGGQARFESEAGALTTVTLSIGT